MIKKISIHSEANMIIAIGGGEVKDRETLAIDKFIVASAKKSQPNFLFIPTASSDSNGYISTVCSLYEELGCQTEALYLCEREVDYVQIKEQIEKADIIYVGGGNTEYMMQLWRKYGVDKLLLEAYQDGKILSGLSAGSICWFIAGYSDSEVIAGLEHAKYKWVKGLGILPYLHCPHYDEPERVGFDDYFKGQITDAIAIENQAAIVWDKHNISVIKSDESKNVYLLSWTHEGLSKKILA